MSICTICGEEYHKGGMDEPPELCLCGEMASAIPWQWDGFRGVFGHWRYRFGRILLAIAEWVLFRPYHKEKK